MRTYDRLDRLTSIVDSGASGTVASFAYTYDLGGHILTEADLSGRVDSYIYDNLYRVTQQSIADPIAGASSLTYSYDLVGNRVTETSVSSSGTQTYNYTYNANNQLTGVTGTSGYSQTYTYDTNGNTTKIVTGGTTATYTWDPSGRMTGYSSGSTTVSYTYDDAGNRLTETTNGQKTTNLQRPEPVHDQVLEEYCAGGFGRDLHPRDRTAVPRPEPWRGRST